MDFIRLDYEDLSEPSGKGLAQKSTVTREEILKSRSLKIEIDKQNSVEKFKNKSNEIRIAGDGCRIEDCLSGFY